MNSKDLMSHKMLIFSLFGGAVFIIAFILSEYMGANFLSKIPSCPFRSITGLYCPGCGLRTAIRELADFNLIKSFIHYPALIYSVAIYIPCVVSHAVYEISGKKTRVFPLKAAYMYICIDIIIFNCIIKNVIIIFSL